MNQNGQRFNKFCKKDITIKCVIDSASTITLISSKFVNEHKLIVYKGEPVEVRQADGKFLITKKCNLNLKIGKINRNVSIYVVDNNLPYLILGLPECKKFKLVIDCVIPKVYQNGFSLNLITNDSGNGFLSLHMQDEYSVNYKGCNDNCVTDYDNNTGVDNKCIDNEPRTLTTFNDINIDDDYFDESETNCITEVNLSNECFNRNNLVQLNNTTDSDLNHEIRILEIDREVKGLLQNYVQIFSVNKYDIGKIRMEPPRLILNSDLPVSLRAYRTSPVEEQEIRTQVKALLEAGIIKESHSSYSSPVTLAKKRDEGKTRLCIDFRKLNTITKTDAEPLPQISCILDKLSKAKFFSTLDLTSGYWHVALHPKDTEKTAFATTFGLFEWLRLPFGLKNAPAIFNRTIRRILDKYKVNFACHYFDDIIIFSESKAQHLEHLKRIFEICVKENIKLKLSKCKFMKQQINFLGYCVQEGTISPDNVNVEKIKNLQPPNNVKELQRFLGTINVYNKFIPNYAKVRHPLNVLLKKGIKWHWTERCQETFETLKNLLISKPILQLYDVNKECHLYVDASKKQIGAVLKQVDEHGVLHPISYHSRVLKSYEENYSITELECLSIVDSLDKFYHYLHGQKFTIHTDHAALVWLKNVKNLRGRLFRWSLKLSMFDYEIKYQKGTTNVEADMLSRNIVSEPIQQVSHLLELQKLIEYQKKDNVQGPNYKNINDVIYVKRKGLNKIVVPFSLRLDILHKAHEEFGHPGVNKTIQLITPQYYWPNINDDINNYVKHCHICQINKKKRQKRFGLLQEVPPTDQPFECLSLDTVGGFNYYNSTKKYLHLVIDHATRYIWAFPSKSVTTETYTNCLKQIFQIQTPKKLLTDRNAAFTSSKFRRFLENNNVKQLLTTPHHPQTNGKVERVNQTIITRLRCKVNSVSNKVPWTNLLNEVVNEYNHTPHSVTQMTPAYLLLGTLPYETHNSNQNFYPPLNEARRLAKERTIAYHKRNKVKYDARFVESKFNVGDLVLYEEFQYPNTRKLTSPYSGPYTILKQVSKVNYEIDKPNFYNNRESEIVHACKLRYYNDPKKLKLYHE